MEHVFTDEFCKSGDQEWEFGNERRRNKIVLKKVEGEEVKEVKREEKGDENKT